MISRRALLASLCGTAVAVAVPRSGNAQSPAISGTGLRGAIDAGTHGVKPGGGSAMQRKLERLIADAARQNLPVFLPPGDYPVSGLMLPDGARLSGIAGASRLVQAGSEPLLEARDVQRTVLAGLVFDGVNRPIAGDTAGLIQFRNVANLAIEDCEVTNSGASGLRLEGCGGRIERCHILRAKDYALYAVQSSSLSVANNIVSACGDGGILIHRWEKGHDGTIVSGNRISSTGASSGGTGQYGNAINLYRADDVTVSGNQVSESAFSAIRANSASNAIITDNHCIASGETAIYAEFSFEGAVISGNLVDGAANGISVVNFNAGGRLATVAGNIVRNLRLSGPYTVDDPIFGVGISAEADTAVSGNVIENAPYAGLALGFGPYLRNVTATGNIIRQAGVGCAVTVVEGSGDVIIANNIFQSATRGGIIGYRWRDAATGDLAKAGAQAFGHLTIENNRVS
ncbi:TIGR03808 family TAT-translocated repetitive protein [Neorhizobium sp. NCHU2750]|uniref:TIGR03808 family TAT-translocated repetitive protein n=1 Tax=Neorhizobium sp. NCHU2750 TaxID=1825976 RepID=UPI000E74A769|nr:Tat protein [Neorhizobium sp. NCHU2750]